MLWFFPYHIPYQPETPISHFRDRPVPIFSDARFSYLALVQDKKITCVLPAKHAVQFISTAPPSQFSMLFLFKINNSLYTNRQILTISHIIT